MQLYLHFSKLQNYKGHWFSFRHSWDVTLCQFHTWPGCLVECMFLQVSLLSSRSRRSGNWTSVSLCVKMKCNKLPDSTCRLVGQSVFGAKNRTRPNPAQLVSDWRGCVSVRTTRQWLGHSGHGKQVGHVQIADGHQWVACKGQVMGYDSLKSWRSPFTSCPITILVDSYVWLCYMCVCFCLMI